VHCTFALPAAETRLVVSQVISRKPCPDSYAGFGSFDQAKEHEKSNQNLSAEKRT
jgi:hypothetical protein